MFTRRKKIAAAVVAGVLGLLLALPYVLPVSSFIPEVEARISERLHEPVKIGGLRLFLLPVPHLTAQDITIGKARLVHVNGLLITPSVLSLFGDTLVLRQIRLDGVQVRQELLIKVNRWVKEEAARQGSSAGAAPPSVRIERITLREADIRFHDFWLNGLEADIEFADGKPVEVRASQDGGRLRVTARPESKDSWRLTIAGRNWKVPVGLALQFDQLDAEATLTGFGISTKNLSGTLYGGSVAGPVAVTWNPGWLVTGALDIEKVAIEPVVALLHRDVAVSGRLTAGPRFTLKGRDAGALLDGLEMDSDFSVADGAIQKVDLIAAAKNPFDKQAGKGGKTEFDRLVGHLVVDPGGYQFSDLEVSSGLFTATGDVALAKDQKLDGRIDVELKGTASLISMPLHVSGTGQEPRLFLTRSSMAAAVAGSVLLPGIGTAAGIKASQFTDKLFGPKRKKRKQEAAEPAQPAPSKSGRQ